MTILQTVTIYNTYEDIKKYKAKGIPEKKLYELYQIIQCDNYILDEALTSSEYVSFIPNKEEWNYLYTLKQYEKRRKNWWYEISTGILKGEELTTSDNEDIIKTFRTFQDINYQLGFLLHGELHTEEFIRNPVNVLIGYQRGV